MRAVYESQRSVDRRCLSTAPWKWWPGYTAVKVLITPPTEALSSIVGLSGFAARMMETLCVLAVGDGVDIMIDCHGRHSLANALEFCRILAPYSPYFIEEPVPPENVDLIAEVRKASPVPIATGERLVTRHQFRRIFEMCACHVIQPDLCHCGGLWRSEEDRRHG